MSIKKQNLEFLKWCETFTTCCCCSSKIAVISISAFSVIVGFLSLLFSIEVYRGFWFYFRVLIFISMGIAGLIGGFMGIAGLILVSLILILCSIAVDFIIRFFLYFAALRHPHILRYLFMDTVMEFLQWPSLNVLILWSSLVFYSEYKRLCSNSNRGERGGGNKEDEEYEVPIEDY